MNKSAPDSLRRSWGSRRQTQTRPDNERSRRRKWLVKRLKKLDVGRIMSRLAERGRKWRQLRRTQHPTTEKLPVFVVGCNRSGTNMVCAALGNSPHGWAFQESELSLAFSAYHLRADWIIERLIRHTPAPLVGFGSILDSQFTDGLLSRFDGAKAIWIYRRYEDVANSCARMQWGRSLKDLVRWTARGEFEKLGARGKRISDDTVRLFGDLLREDLSNEEAACLYWYMRNQVYFDLNLHTDPRVLIMQYEDTVQNPVQAFHRVFRFLGLPFDPAVVGDVFASSVGKNTWLSVDPAIEKICDALKARLDAQYAATSDWTLPDTKKPAAATNPSEGG